MRRRAAPTPRHRATRSSDRHAGQLATAKGSSKAPLFAARDGRTPSMRGSLPAAVAACGTARTPDLRGHIAARRRYVPVKTQWETRKAFEIGRDPRFMALLNLLRSERRARKVEHASRAPCLKGTVDLVCMHSDPPFILSLAILPLTKLPCSPPRTIQAFGRLARGGGCSS